MGEEPMRKFITVSLFIIFALSQSVPLFGQDQEASGPERIDDLLGFKRSGQASMPYLSRGAGARTMGLADAGIAMKGDASALFYNPAGIAYVENRTVMFGNMNWLMDTSIQSGALVMNFGQLGAFGISAMNYNYGDPIQATALNGTNEAGYSDIGELNPSEWVIGVAYARRISEQFSVGGQVKYAHQDLLGSGFSSMVAYRNEEGQWVQEAHDAKMGIVAFDVGTIYDTGFRGLSLAMSFRNFGPGVKYERETYDIPLNFRFGVAGDVFSLLNQPMNDMGLDLRVDYLHPRDWTERINVGLEYSLRDMFFVRGGYKFNYSSEGLCLGGGLNVNLPIGAVQVDYAFKGTGETLFDAVHVYSVSLDF